MIVKSIYSVNHLGILILAYVITSAPVYGGCRDIQQLGHIDASALRNDLMVLSSEKMAGRKAGTPGNLRALDYIQKRFTHIGLHEFPSSPTYLQYFRFPEKSQKKQGTNIVGWIKGSERPNKYIVISAHYDHLGQKSNQVFYGADDNASGVATMLSIAMNTITTPPIHSVIFLATDAEEQGLHGAKAFIKSLPVEKHAILLNINLDMLAEGGRRKTLYATHSIGASHLAGMIENAASQAGICLVKNHKRSERGYTSSQKVNWRKASDHAAFSNVGIPYIFVGGGIHNRYHTVKDSFENVDQQFFHSATEAAWLIFKDADSYTNY